MKRLALLVVGALVATALALTPNVAAWYETPVTWRSYMDPDGSGNGYNLGGSTKYGYSGPAGDTHPQFYAGAETHGVGYYAYSVKITVTGVDPTGATLSGDRFTSPSALHSPSGGTYEEVMDFIYQTLTNALPYGIGSDISYLADSQPTGYDSTSAWGQWTTCFLCYPADAGLRFGFQIAVDPGLSGSYRIQVGYHFGVVGGDGQLYWKDLDPQNLVYCYNYCTYKIAPIHVQEGGYSVSGADVWIRNSGGYDIYHAWTDANGNAPGKWGLTGGTYTARAQICQSVYRPEPPGYDYFYFTGQTTVTIGPDASPTVSLSNSHIAC